MGTTVKKRYASYGLSSLARAMKATLSSLAIYYITIFTGLVLICAVVLTAYNLISISFVFEKNYNEGWNVYNAERLINHELIYDNDYWRVNNYPIGSFLIIRMVDFLANDLLLSGRLVALASFAAVGVLAALVIRRFGGEGIDALFGAGCTLGFCYLVAPAWIMVDDPQTLGEAVMLGGLVSYVSKPADSLNLSRTAFLVVLAGFIKHNLPAIPLAITFDLAIRSPRRLLFWVGCCAALAAGFLGLTHLVAGGSFIDHLLSPRVFTWESARYHLMKYIRLFKFPVIAILLVSRPVFSGERLILAGYGMLSIILATIFSGFEGSSYNMFQDAAVFLGIAAGVMLYEVRKRVAAGSGLQERLKIVLGALPLLVGQPIWARSSQALLQIYQIDDLLELDHRTEQSFLADAKYVSERGGPAICESLLLCYIAGQQFILDPFNSRQYILAGRLDEDQLIRRIAAQEFVVIQLRADICDDRTTASCHILHYRQKFNRFTDETLYAIDRHYEINRRSRNGTFYVPK